VDGQPVDHGCPFLHGRSPEFSRLLDELDPAENLPGWPVRVRESRLACQPEAFAPGLRRLARADGMTALPKHLAQGLDVRLEHELRAIECEPGFLRVRCENGSSFEAETLVSAMSIGQSLALLEPLVQRWPGAPGTRERMHGVEIVPVLTWIAGWPADSPDPGFDSWHPMETTMIGAIHHDSTKRRAPRHRVLVVHGRPAFSREYLDADPATWAAELQWELGELLGPWAARPAWAQAHRWEGGRVRNADLLGGPVEFAPPSGGTILVVGDAFAATPGVEGAHASGNAAGERLATQGDSLRADTK
jgi:predicted NAD/FAD-dependent oxidoreductase